MLFVIDYDPDDIDNVNGRHCIDLSDAKSLAAIKALSLDPTACNKAGWDRVVKHPDHQGKTLMEAVIDMSKQSEAPQELKALNLGVK